VRNFLQNLLVSESLLWILSIGSGVLTSIILFKCNSIFTGFLINDIFTKILLVVLEILIGVIVHAVVYIYFDIFQLQRMLGKRN
jgi:hypothetical protein